MSVIVILLVLMLIAGGFFLSKGNHTPEHKRLSRYGGEQGQALPFFAIVLAGIAVYIIVCVQHASIYSAF